MRCTFCLAWFAALAGCVASTPQQRGPSPALSPTPLLVASAPSASPPAASPPAASPHAASPPAASAPAAPASASSSLVEAARGWTPLGPAGSVGLPPPRRTTPTGLIVNSPPATPRYQFRGRLRLHIEGALSIGSTRTWIGPDVPDHVPIALEGMELFLLELAGNETLAFYREPYGGASCQLSSRANCAYGAALFGKDGKLLWASELNPFLSRDTFLEIQDVRYAGGVLYFNEACQSYSSEAGGRCSSLVALDVRAGRVLWRTPPLVSNNVFLIVGDHLLAGYGFTNEPDRLALVRRSDGAVVARLPTPVAHNHMQPLDGRRVRVGLDDGKSFVVRIDAPGSGAPRLVREPG